MGYILLKSGENIEVKENEDIIASKILISNVVIKLHDNLGKKLLFWIKDIKGFNNSNVYMNL